MLQSNKSNRQISPTKNYINHVYELVPTEYAGKGLKSTIAPKNKETEIAKQVVQKLVTIENTSMNKFKERHSSFDGSKVQSTMQ